MLIGANSVKEGFHKLPSKGAGLEGGAVALQTLAGRRAGRGLELGVYGGPALLGLYR